MVLKKNELEMSSEQPVKKKLKKNEEMVDETDFISENGMGALHLTVPGIIGQNDVTMSSEPCVQNGNGTNHERVEDLSLFRDSLVRQCLCGVPENLIKRSFEGQNGNSVLMSWPTNEVLQLLSNLQLLFDVYLKQNNKGYICAPIVNICNALIRNECNLIGELLTLINARNRYVNYMLARVLSSFLVIAKSDLNTEWLESIASCLSLDYVDYDKMNFGLQVIRTVVEWKDASV